MASIPIDLVLEVLARLPVKDLLRFRCVSKLFRSLIDSPDFRKLHLSLSRKTQIHVYGIESLVQFEYPQFKVFDVTNSVNDVSVVTVNRSPGFKPKPLWVFAGSCNGLIALSQSGARGDIMFWNPLTGKSKSVASFIPHNFPITYGFGYDPKTDDYKLVRIAVLYNENHPNQVTLRTAVYSLKMDSWKQIGNDLSVYGRFGFWHDQPGVLANNALHWINRDEIDDRKIVAFDLINEEFYYVSVLGGFQYDYYIWKLSVLDGCLALTFRYGKHNNVWVMKEYGVKESWTRVLSYLRSALSYSDNIYPLVYSSSRDKFLLSCSSSWYWFDLISGKYDRCPNKNGYLRTLPLKLFSGSLIAPDDSTHVVDLKRKQTVLENNKENEEEKRRKTKQVESL